MEEGIKSVHRVQDRLNILNTIKSIDGLPNKSLVWGDKAKAKRVKPKNTDKSDIKTDLGLTVKLTKDAELLAGFQEYEFMPLDDDARKNVNLFKPIWFYRWAISRTDKMLTKVIPSATTYGTGIMYEGIRTIKRKIKVPYYEKGELKSKEDIITDYDGIYCEYIPFNNFYIDGDDIDNANEAIWIKYRDREDYISSYKLSNYNLNEIPLYKEYSTTVSEDVLKYNQDDDTVIMEMKYYNVSSDEYIILANGKEVFSSFIPYTHKQLPFCLFYDYKVDGRIYGMGEFELLTEDEDFKDKLRSLYIDVIKAQMGTILIQDDIDFEDGIFEYGTNTYARVDDVNGIKHFAPTINASIIENAENKLDSDIIAKTGIDIRQQLYTPGETAKKTDTKQASVKKKINLNLKINGFDFFERLARLRVANIQLIMSKEDKKIPVKGKNITEDLTEEALAGGYGSFTVKPEYTVGKFNLIPIVDSLTGENKEATKTQALQFDQIIGNIVGEDGKPVVTGERRVELLADIFEVDYEKLISSVAAEQSTEDIMRELENTVKGVPNDEMNPANPNFIPPEQRSGATTGLSGITAN